MQLTSGQYAALKAAIAANSGNTVVINGSPTAINAVPVSPDNCQAIADWYNLTAAGPYKVWNTTVNLKDIRALVNLQNYTPADAVPASGGTATITNDQLRYQNQALVCQLKQANAIFLISGEGIVDCSPLQYRQSFNDCMSAIPSGAGGAGQNAGWGTSTTPGVVRLAMQRSATNVEKLYSAASTAAPNAGNVGADARGAATNPDTLVFVGPVSGNDVLLAMSS
jgi:hypothetical protein